MKKTLLLALILVGCSHSETKRIPAQSLVDANQLAEALVNKEEAETKLKPWGGYWWSMQRGELVTGWDDGKGRKIWTEGNIKQFDKCIDSYTKECVDLFKNIAKENGKHLSPLMKFDYFVRLQNEKKYGKNNGLKGEYTHAAKWEVDNHYIGNNDAHRYWSSRGYAGKRLGWAFSTMENPEPTKDKVMNGVLFRPADIKGILAAIYNGAQFFVPDEMIMGKEYREDGGTEADYADVSPKQLISALRQTIKKDRMLEADMDPSDGVWNHPVYKYKLTWDFKKPTLVKGRITLHYVSDELGIDDVFTGDPKRQDIVTRDLDFEIAVKEDFVGDFESLKADGKWLGEAVDKHPDAIIMGLEKGWRTTIYEYKNSSMKTEVNFPLIKRVKVGSKWVPLVDLLVKDYYKK